ncbi:hypothetical protein T190115A13A_20007 [Tenacibaculum sp. 190524A02b]|uniref:Uncharacterized protein n=1 Tax=Tenacibaculum vairaonense TaxID=3137860 RepID=A0ABM9PM07_9FLAO
MNKKNYKEKIKKSELLTNSVKNKLQIELETKARKKQKQLKNEFKNMTLKEVENLYAHYLM